MKRGILYYGTPRVVIAA